jgi:hypothetical protein
MSGRNLTAHVALSRDGSPLMALAPGQLFAGYEILAEIGRGGMGAVYQARQVSLQRLVALKILPQHLAEDASYAARFQSEAIAAANLNHPNIVQVFAAGESDGIRYIAMEFIEGETIQQRIRRCGRLPLTEALDIAYHVATALDYAWQNAQLIHRDVKPDNIFLAHHGTVKLGDFGIAKMLREGASSMTVTGHIMGSPHYISPEQARGERDTDFRADIYSLGCTLYTTMTGRTVFEGPDFMSVMYKHVNDEPSPLNTLLPHCPAEVNRLVMQMLSKDREARHASYGTLLEDLAAVRQEAALWEASDERQRQRMAKREPARVHASWTYVVAVLLALAAAVTFTYGRRVPKQVAAAAMVTLDDPSDRRDFIQSLESLGPYERGQRVMAKMRELNPRMTGKERLAIEDGVVTELTFSAIGVTNLWPLTGLPNLRVLRCTGDATTRRRAELRDLSPVQELSALEELDCSWSEVDDLGPVSNLWLRALNCSETRVASLAPLASVPLSDLNITRTRVSDLAPLRGKSLLILRCDNTRVRDLSPLQGMPLRSAWIDPRLQRAQVVKTWRYLESLNGQPAPR